MPLVAVMGGFDKIKSGQVRFLEQASKFGELHVYLWSDRLIQRLNGSAPDFPQLERAYFLESIRYVSRLTLVDDISSPGQLPISGGLQPDIWVVSEDQTTPHKRQFCAEKGVECRVISQAGLQGYPPLPSSGGIPASPERVVVTGTFDWLHSGHVRFFEETSALGDLYVVVGHDDNIRLLKGEGHPLFPQQERAYLVQSIRFVTRTLISSGHGWLDGEPEIKRINPRYYAVNKDGDKPEKRDFCLKHGIEYVVLERTPKQGLPRRESTQLRGF